MSAWPCSSRAPLEATALDSLVSRAWADLSGDQKPQGFLVDLIRCTVSTSRPLVRDRAELAVILERLGQMEVRELFVVGGDVDEPVGEFPDAHGLLAAMSDMAHRLEEIGITGYPESHPFIDDDVTIKAMWDKRGYATTS